MPLSSWTPFCRLVSLGWFLEQEAAGGVLPRSFQTNIYVFPQLPDFFCILLGFTLSLRVSVMTSPITKVPALWGRISFTWAISGKPDILLNSALRVCTGLLLSYHILGCCVHPGLDRPRSGDWDKYHCQSECFITNDSKIWDANLKKTFLSRQRQNLHKCCLPVLEFCHL